MKTETFLRQAVRSALAVGAVGSLAGVGIAMAQTAAPAGSTAGQATQLSKITVVGSRIPRTSIATSQPVVTISRQQIQASGFTTLGQVLQNMPQAGPTINLQVTNNVGQSAGAEYVNLHNMGSERLLVLVNGQRWTASINGATDLSTIPTAIISRIEILLDGASAVYGSDAIAGVINIITVKNFNGAEASGTFGMYDAHGVGGGWDGRTQKYNFVVGSSNDRSGVLMSAGYTEMDPIRASNRTISKEPYIGQNLFGFGLINIFDSSRTPGGRFTLIVPNPPPSIASACSPVGGGYYYCDLAGPLTGPGATPSPFTGKDRFNYQPYNYIQNPTERWYAYSQGHYDLSDNLTFHGSIMYSHRVATLLGAPAPLDVGYGSTLSANGMPIGIAANNPYNPFGVDLVPFTPTSATGAAYNDWCRTYGSGPNGGCTTNVGYLKDIGFRPINMGPRVNKYNIDTFRFTGGFNGYFQALDNQWAWHADYVYSNQRATSTQNGLWDMARVAQALGNIDNCQPSIQGCVPFNIFGGQAGFKPNQVNYLKYTAVNTTTGTLLSYSAGIEGNLLNSWYAGPWGLAAGYNYYVNKGQYTPDSLIASGNSSTNQFLPTGGRVATGAQYAELNVPWGLGVRGFEKFSTDIAWRWSQHKWNGTVFQGGLPQAVGSRAAVNTGRLGFKWSPISQLLIRGTWSQGFRVPSVSELFQGGAQSYPFLADPCVINPANPNCPSNAPGPVVQQYKTTFQGNPYLNPETAISQSLGFVWSPTFAPGVNIAMDYYKINLNRYIAARSPQQILNDCYSAASLFCNQITRVGGAIKNINAGTINQGSFFTNGWDVNLGYRFPATSIGQFDVALHTNFVKFFTTCNVSPITHATTCRNTAGSASMSIPKHKYDMAVNWNYGPWAATWNVLLIGPMYESCMWPYYFTGTPGAPPTGSGFPSCTNPNALPYGLNRLGTTVYHDVYASYTISSWNTTLSLGIQNLFNKQPPFTQTSWIVPNYDYMLYRTPGRYIYAGASIRF